MTLYVLVVFLSGRELSVQGAAAGFTDQASCEAAAAAVQAKWEKTGSFLDMEHHCFIVEAPVPSHKTT